MSKVSKNNLRFAVLAADTALFTIRDGGLCLRLIRVHRPPFFINRAGLPGGLIAPAETAEAAARRHLKTKAGIFSRSLYLEQLYTFSAVNRDPRGRVVAVAYLAIIPWEDLSTKETMDADGAWWCPVTKLPKLAYDHNEIVVVALERLRSRITYTTLINKLMPQKFTLVELERAYGLILNRKLDRRNFRKKINKLGILKALRERVRGGRFRPASLYSFRSSKVELIEVV